MCVLEWVLISGCCSDPRAWQDDRICRYSCFVSESSTDGRLILVCGLPGSGKTTHARHLEAKLGAVRFCPDEWMDALALDLYDEARRERIEKLHWQLAQELLAAGLTVIIEWGTWARSERDALRLGARAQGAAVELHYLAASPEVLFQRIDRRAMESPPIRREQVLRWFEQFQPPTPAEMALYDQPLPGESDAEQS